MSYCVYDINLCVAIQDYLVSSMFCSYYRHFNLVSFCGSIHPVYIVTAGRQAIKNYWKKKYRRKMTKHRKCCCDKNWWNIKEYCFFSCCCSSAVLLWKKLILFCYPHFKVLNASKQFSNEIKQCESSICSSVLVRS